MKEHPQAEILRAISEGKTVEWKLSNKDWKVCENPLHFISDPYAEFRIKPATITINGHEVLAPVREPLEIGQTYWVVSIGDSRMTYTQTWDDDAIDYMRLERNLIHLTQKAAIAHAEALLEALLSFTRSKECAT